MGTHRSRVCNHLGFVFACWSPDTPEFEEYMGETLYHFDEYCELPDGSHSPLEAFGGIFKWRIPNNWKFGAENFAGDMYHNPSHQSVDAVVLSPGGAKGRHTYDPVTSAREAHLLIFALRLRATRPAGNCSRTITIICHCIRICRCSMSISGSVLQTS